MSRLLFSDLVKIWRASVPSSNNDEFVIQYLSDEILECLQLALSKENEAKSGITLIEPDPEELEVGAKVVLSFGKPRKGLGLYCKDFDEYLNHVGNKYREASNYYVHEIDYYSADDLVHPTIEKYRELLELIGLLRSAVFHFDEGQESFVFAYNGKRVFPLVYDLALIERLDFGLLKRFLVFFDGDLHHQQKLDFLSKQIAELADCTLPERCFKEVLCSLDDVFVKIQMLYREFSSDFSMAKFEQELQEIFLGFTKRISDIFSGVQTQILSIPLASVIAVTQVRLSTTLDRQFAANLAIMIGVFIFTVVLLGVLYNQHVSLRVIERDLLKQMGQFKIKFADYSVLYEKDLCSLQDRLGLSFLGIGLLYGIAIIGFFVCLVYFVVHTLPIYNALF